MARTEKAHFRPDIEGLRAVAIIAVLLFHVRVPGNDKVCSCDPCPLIVGKTMMCRDHGHLTATFSRQLAPSMRVKVRSALGAR